MQPPRPLCGVPYDKDMFTFLPALASQDVLVESSRKRKLMAPDSQTTISAPTMGYGPFRNLRPEVNASDLRGNQSFVPTSSHRESSTFRNHSDTLKFGHQYDSSAPWDSNKRDFFESRSDWHENSSFAGQSHSSNHNDLPSLIHSLPGMAYKSNQSPLVTEDFNQRVIHDSNAHTGATLTKVEESFSSELAHGDPQNLLQNSSKPGVYIANSDEKGCHGHSYQAETSSKIELGGSSNNTRIDNTKMLGNNVGDSILNLAQTNSILQQALRLLKASSGTVLTVNQDGSNQSCGGDAMSNKSSTPNSQTENSLHSSINDTLSKSSESGLNVNKFIVSGDKNSINIDGGVKSENGGSALAEKLWDGTLKLSSSVIVSAVAFFKSGERMQDFRWSGAVEVKGKVRLEAFEKYVQDLPRSRTRGLMVMSLVGKEGSSAANLKSMSEVAIKYREGRRVGFAQLNKSLDMYVCPNSDTVITILAKHGFFKGLTAVSEKPDPLIGCVVWRKNSSSAPVNETTVIDAAHLETSFIKQSDENSDKIQAENGVVQTSRESPNTCVAPCIVQPSQSMIPENKLISVSELNRHVETVEPNSLVPLVPNQSIALSDDEDLPEYDFGAVISKTSESNSSLTATVSPTPEKEQFRASNENKPHIAQTRSESSTVSQTLTDPRYQGLPKNSEIHSTSIRMQQEKEREGCTTLRTSDHGPSLFNKEHEPVMMISSWAIEEKKPANDCNATMKQKNLFDDDDMPEWCPPDLKKMRPEVNESPGPIPVPGPSMVSRFSFTDMATGRQLPTPPPLPPFPPPALTKTTITTTTSTTIIAGKIHPTENQLSLPPPLPPLPPPTTSRSLTPPPPLSNQAQFFDKNYPSAPHFPNQAVTALVHGNPDVNKTSMQFSSSAPTHMQFQPTHYPPLPPPPLPPTPHPSLNQAHFSNNNHSAPHFSRPVVNNSMHNRPVLPPRHEQFGEQRYPPASPLARPPVDKPEPRREVPPFPPNPGFRPQFHMPWMNHNQAHHSAWRSSRP